MRPGADDYRRGWARARAPGFRRSALVDLRATAPSTAVVARRYVAAVVVGAVAWALNQVQLVGLTEETPSFLLGGGLVFIAFLRLGAGPGVCAALLSLASPLTRGDVGGLTHLVYVAEAAAAWWLYRKFRSLPIAVAVFWLAAGWELDLAIYLGLVGVPGDYVLLLFVKQLFNGVLNAVAAEVVLLLVGRSRQAALASQPPTLRQYAYARVGLVALVPTLLISLLFARDAYREQIDRAEGDALRTARDVAATVRAFTDEREFALGRLARQVELRRNQGDTVAAPLLRAYHQGHPEFLHFGVTDSMGIVVVASPDTSALGAPLRGRSVAARAYFEDARDLLRTVYAPLTLGTLHIREPEELEPGLTIAEPLLDQAGEFVGVLYGALDTRALLSLVGSGRDQQLVTLLGPDRRTIVSLDAARPPGTSLRGAVPADVATATEPRTLKVDAALDESARAALGLEVRRAAFQPILDVGWGVLVEMAPRVLYARMRPAAIETIAFMVTILAVLHVVVGALSGGVAQPLVDVERRAVEIAEGRRLEPGALERLGNSPIAEVRSLAARLGTMEQALERQRADTEARAAQQAERFDAVARTTSDIVWEWDVPAHRAWWSPGTAARFGYSPDRDAAQAEWWIERIHPEDRQAVGADLRAALAAAPEWSGEFRLRRADGSYAPIFMRGVIVRDADGQALRIVGVAADLTERRQAEEERARLEDQLRQAQKMEAIGHLAGGVAHDFNNLLTPIIGYADMLQWELGPGHPLAPDVRQIREAADHARGLVQQLLAFSRRQVLAMRTLDLNEEVRRAHEILRRVIPEDIVIDLALADDLGAVRADPAQIQTILINLAVNARDAMSSGGVLTIATRNVDFGASPPPLPEMPAGAWVTLTVGDTGHGMTPEVRRRIFEPFFTTKEVGRGTGLGLATVHGVVRQHGGHIAVASAPGRGAVFTIYLPRAAAEAPVAAPPRAPAAAARGRGTILVAEDEPAVRRLVCTYFTRQGYTVLDAGSPEDALETARGNGPIDLLLTDVVMPRMNGRELARRVNAMHPGLKVVYMSGHSEEVLSRHGELEPGITLIAKPFELDALGRVIAEVLAR